jgi:hypothetical protein
MILKTADDAGIDPQVKPGDDAPTQHVVSTGQPPEIHSLCTGESRYVGPPSAVSTELARAEPGLNSPVARLAAPLRPENTAG